MSKALDRSTIRRHAERSVPDEFDAIMQAGHVAHVSFCVAQQPHVIPLIYQYSADDPENVYLHGATESRTLRHLAAGVSASICVTLLDGLVYSRTAMNHSANYRSAVCFGRCQEVRDPETKRRVFEAMTSRYFRLRVAGIHYEPATIAQLDATTMVALRIEERSAKARRGGPTGPTDAQPGGFGTCGVVDIRS